MNVLIVYAHPEPESFNGAMYRLAIESLTTAGHTVRQSDLYAMGFNPVSGRSNFSGMMNSQYFKQQLEELYATETGSFAPDIEAEQQKLEWCDIMIWQFPLWWFGTPGILKGWVDRVFAMGRVYGRGKLYEAGVFRGKRALLSLTTGGSEDDYLKDGLNGDLSGILKPVQRGILEFTGFSVLAPHVVYGPARQAPEELAQELEKWNFRLKNIENEKPVLIGRY